MRPANGSQQDREPERNPLVTQVDKDRSIVEETNAEAKQKQRANHEIAAFSKPLHCIYQSNRDQSKQQNGRDKSAIKLIGDEKTVGRLHEATITQFKSVVGQYPLTNQKTL